MRMRALAAGCGLLMASAHLASAQFPLDVRVNVEKDSVRIGDPFRIFIYVVAPKGATIEFPETLDSTSTIQSIDPRTVFSQPDSTGFAQNAVYRVAAWDIGRQPIRLTDIVVKLGDRSRTIPIIGRSIFIV